MPRFPVDYLGKSVVNCWGNLDACQSLISFISSMLHSHDGKLRSLKQVLSHSTCFVLTGRSSPGSIHITTDSMDTSGGPTFSNSFYIRLDLHMGSAM